MSQTTANEVNLFGDYCLPANNDNLDFMLPVNMEGIFDKDLFPIPTMSGSDFMNDTYNFESLHFHWSDTDNITGSETEINNKTRPLEVNY